MDVSRRDFLRFSVGAASGTALAGLVGSGVNLGPTIARAQELRIKNAKVTPESLPLLLGRLRHAGPYGGRTYRQHRGRSPQSSQ